MKKVLIYTDGACSGNPGPGGWAAILRYGKSEKEISGAEAQSTNNRMEMTAAIEALSILKEPCEVTLSTDSQYIVNAINKGWLESWKQKGWKRKGGEIKNIDLWLRFSDLLDKHKVTLRWVKGHGDDEYNIRCDELAVAKRKKIAT